MAREGVTNRPKRRLVILRMQIHQVNDPQVGE